MKKGFKISILFVTIALPVAIFLFLKHYGENQFDIPIYYQEENTVMDTDCGVIYFPYIVPLFETFTPDSLTLPKIELADINLFIILPNEKALIETLNQIDRLKATFGYQPQVKFFLLQTGDIKLPSLDKYENILDHDGVFNFVKCGLLVQTYFDITNETKHFTTGYAVLVDKDRRIRGYYEISDREEVDRVISEIDILLKFGYRGTWEAQQGIF